MWFGNENENRIWIYLFLLVSEWLLAKKHLVHNKCNNYIELEQNYLFK